MAHWSTARAVSGIGLVVAVGVGAYAGPDEPTATPTPTPTPTVTPSVGEDESSVDDPEQAPAEAVVRSLDAGSEQGIAPEVLDAVGDQEVLPPGARVEPAEGTWVREGELATMEVIVHLDDGGSDRHAVFMEKRDGQWLVLMTAELGDDDE